MAFANESVDIQLSINPDPQKPHHPSRYSFYELKACVRIDTAKGEEILDMLSRVLETYSDATASAEGKIYYLD